MRVQTTTWYKPKKEDVSEAAKATDFVSKSERTSSGEAAAEVKIDFDVQYVRRRCPSSPQLTCGFVLDGTGPITLR